MYKTAAILLADDHPLLLKGLVQEFKNNGYTNVFTAKNGVEALDFIINKKPDFAILDIEMPFLTGFEVVQKAKATNIKTKFIILSYLKEKGFIVQAKKLQIDGYLVKDDHFSEIENCMQSLNDNDIYISNSFSSDELEKVNKQAKSLQFLTPSERTIIRSIASGQTSTEISIQLNISIRTVQKHRTNIIAKLELQSTKDALSEWTEKHKALILTL